MGKNLLGYGTGIAMEPSGIRVQVRWAEGLLQFIV